MPRFTYAHAALAFLFLTGFLAVPPSRAHCLPWTWSLTAGGAGGFEIVTDLREEPGGFLRVAGTSDSFGTGTSGAWILRLDPMGRIASQRIFRSSSIETIGHVHLAPDGGAAITGARFVEFNARTGWVLRVDPLGEVAWATSFSTGTTFGRHFLTDVAPAPGDGWFASGFTSDFDFPPVSAWIVRLDGSGAVAWQWLYGSGSTEEARRIVPTPDGGFAVAGISDSGAGGSDIWIMKADGDGNVEWQRTLGGTSADEAEAIVTTGDGGYAIAGTTASFTAGGHSGWVIRLDSAGALLWQKTFEAWSDFHGIAETADGDLLVAGRLGDPPQPANEFWLLRLSSADGKIVWQRAYPGAGDRGGWGSAILPLSDGGILAGGAASWGFPEQDLRLLRTDTAGGTGDCRIVRDTSIAEVIPSVTALDGSAVRSVAPQMVGSLTFLAEDTASPASFLCDPCALVGGTAPPGPSPGDPPHPPLRVRPLPAGEIAIEQVAGATAYNIYADSIGSWYFPTAATGTACTIRNWTENPDGTLTLAYPLPRNSWIVATATNACGESSAGRSSAGIERFTVGTWERCPVCP